MKHFAFILLMMTAVACSGQATISGTISTQGGWSMPVTNTLASLTITPPSTTLNDGSSAQFTATGTFALGNTASFTATAVWTSSNLAIATPGTLGATQPFTCVGVGTIVVTATVGTVQATAAINCLAPPSGSADNIYCGPGGVPLGPATDGPASLPTACYYTALNGTPSPGATLGPVAASAIGSTYSTAHCGDTILVTSGTSFTGVTTLTGKLCDDQHYITIESTGVSNINFPAEGTRGTPCQSNTASLPNRPSYPCASPSSLTAKLITPASSKALVLNGTDHVRFIGLEITRIPTAAANVTALVDMTSTGATQTNHIIFDRVWMHGINQDGNFPQTGLTDTSLTRAVYLGQSNHVAILDSFISDIYDNGSTASNGNTDSQCVGGGVGNVQNSGWGVYKFVNNHCEGGSEGLILGGAGGPALSPVGCTFGVNCNIDVPTNIEVRRNYFFAPNSWNGNGSNTSPVSLGYPNRKNGIEFKTGANILLEANLMENCWYSSQPYCYVFDFAPKNQSNLPNTPIVPTCNSCLVQDFVARYNYGYNYPGHQIALYSTQDNGCSSCTTLGRRGSIHDNLVGDSLNKGSLTLGGFDCVEFLANAGPITSISMRHNTCVGAVTALMAYGSRAIGQFDQVTFQDNLMAEGAFGVQASSNSNAGCDNGGTGGSVYDSTNNFLGILNHCVNGTTNTWTADHNATWGSSLLTNWPAGNTLTSGIAGVGFTLVPANNAAGFPDSNVNPGDYALTVSSPFHNAASDGTDVGADVSTLITKITNVRDSPSQQFTPGNLVIYPSSTTVEQGTTVPFSCDNAGNTTCIWTLASGAGTGTLSATGIYTAPSSGGSAVVQAVNGSNLQTANITVTGTTPAATGDCATVPYPHTGMTENVCQMTHTETVGGAVTRKWKVIVPTNYVSGQSGMILHIADSHFLNGFNVDPCSFPTNEIEGWASYLNTVPSPAPVLVCSEGYSSSSGTFSVYNSLGRINYAWLNGVIPNDVDFLRQLILITVRDMNLNPKAVFIENYFNANGNGGMAVQAAAVNSDLVAAVGAGMESNFQAMNSSFTVNATGAPNFGQTLAAPAVPISAITLTGLYVLQTGVFSQICGNNLATSNQRYQPLTVNDTFRFWNQTDATTASSFSPSNVGSSFCTGTYDGSGNGLMSTLEVRKDTGGKLGTAIYAYKLVGNTSKATPFCGYDYNGANTLGCGANNSTAVLDFRNNVCTFSQPCNHFLDAGTGPASASGYSGMDMVWKFFKNHPKP